MLSLACVALLCGRQTILGISEWVSDYGRPYLKHFGFTYPEPPGQATWYRVLGGIEWAELEARTYTWAQQVLRVYADDDTLQGVAIDGKTLRGSKKQGAADAHLLSAVGHQLAVVLAQVAVADKTNEIPTVIELLSHLVIEGHVFTMDALLTQREIAQTIVAGKGDYLFVVKNNQPHLREDIELLFTSPPPQVRGATWPTAETKDLDHGRIETRRLQASTALNDYLDWPGVQQVFQLVRKRTHKKQGTSTTETIYGITSLSCTQASAAQLLTLARQHWTIENQVHWVRDVVFGEDLAQTRHGYLPHTMATLRNTVISLLHANHIHHIARARRRFAARPDEALALMAFPV
ncbi:MAG: ISAs1 family transposase [Anaerolineae bacterium]|nr:ISAs1 family transposase [Anaerolineae bacterium]